MDCFFCHEPAGKVSKDVRAVLCGNCTARLANPPENKPAAVKYTAEEKATRKAERAARKVEKLEKMKSAIKGRGRGWHLKKLFAFEGKFYSFGKEISDVEAAKLRKELIKAEAAKPVNF